MSTLLLDAPVGRLAPTAEDLYFQCDLRYRNDKNWRTVGWIEERGARVGAFVQLKDFGDELWEVVQVHQPGQSLAWLREKQRQDRRSLTSVRGNGVHRLG